MNNIEKKAREDADDAFVRAFTDREMPWSEVREIFKQTFLAGAAYALGNQWRDAEKELPGCGEQVLIMSDDSEYPAFGEWCGNHWEREDADVINRSNDEYYPFKVIAWLPIPEYKTKEE